ncbi:hypothetical protein [Saccharolobus shibatae]|nr:hypothetical protein [Saccharolobus shibatae]
MNAYILLIAILVPEFWVGMTINLTVNLPAEHFDVIASLTYYATHFNLVL